MLDQEHGSEVGNRLIGALLQPVLALFDEAGVSEIAVMPGQVFVTRAGQTRAVGVELDRATIITALKAIGAASHVTPEEGKSSAAMSVSHGGYRFSGALGPISRKGPFLQIRKHGTRRYTVPELIQRQMLSQAQADFIRHEFIAAGGSVLFAGATDSGKTTLMNAFLGLLNPLEKVVSVEDPPELDLPIANWNQLVPDVAAGLLVRELVALIKRLSPRTVVLGELKGISGDAYDLLTIMTSGHRAAATLHAGSVLDAMASWMIMIQQCLPPSANLSTPILMDMMAQAVRLIVVVRQVDLGNGKLGRRVAEIAKVVGVADKKFVFDYFEG